MKTYLLIPIAFILLCSHAFAANPAFQDFYGTNGIIIRTNGNKVQVDGGALIGTNSLLANLVHTNVTWVAKNGDNTTGTPGNFARPYLSISNAVQASPEGTLVVVEPGVYNESVRLKNMVNLYMPSGVIVTQNANLPVMFINNAGAVTSTLSGDFLLYHTGDGSNTDGLRSQGDDSLLTVYGGTINIVGSGDYGISMENGSLKAVGTTIYSGEHGVSNEKAAGSGTVSFIGTVFATNNAAFIDGGNASSNYLRGYFSSQSYHAIQHVLGYLLMEDFEAISYSAGHDTIDYQNGNMDLRRGKITSTDDEPTIGMGGSGLLILDNVQMDTGANAAFSVDDIFGSGTVQLRTPIWATKPFDPAITVASNGFTRLSRYLSITTNNYQFPAAQGFYDSFLRNDGSGALDWTNALQNFTVVSNFTSIQNTILSNVTVRGSLFVTNLFVGGAAFITNQYTTNISGTPVIGSFWFATTNGAPVTNGPRVASIEYIPVMRTWRQGDVGAQGAGHDTIDTHSVSNYWNATNQGFGSVAFGSNNWVWGDYSTIANGMFNIISSNTVGSFIGGGSNNVIHTNSIFSFIGGGSINKIRMNSPRSAIVGGMDNTIRDADWSFMGGGQGNQVGAAGISIQDAVLAGGSANTVFASQAVVSGGSQNDINTTATHAVVAGGQGNDIDTAAAHSAILGGSGNKVWDNTTTASIAGGLSNEVGANGGTAAVSSSIGGGSLNIISGGSDYGHIGGGLGNNILGSPAPDFGSILGGASNNILTSATMATAIGNFISNSTPSAVEIGHGASGGNNRKLRVDANGARVMTYNGSASVGGTYLITNTPIASAGSSETNLQVVTIGAHVLTNNNDRLLVRSSGRFAATSNTKQIQLVFGSEDVFDSGAFVANTGAWTLDCEIIRTGNTAQSCNCSFNGGTNVVYVRTSALDLVQTNGIATVLKITGTASGNGDITNRSMTVTWMPSP